MSKMKKITVKGLKTYSIICDECIEGHLSRLLEYKKCAKVAVFVAKNAGEALCWLKKFLGGLGIDVYSYTFNHDNARIKNINEALLMVNFLTLNGFNHGDLIINLCDEYSVGIGSFVAEMFEQGIDYINIPTSLMCAVNGCLEGRASIDFDQTENKLGSVYAPLAVLIDLKILQKLSEESCKSALAQIAVYGTIDQHLAVLMSSLNGFDELKEHLGDVVYACLKVKSATLPDIKALKK